MIDNITKLESEIEHFNKNDREIDNLQSLLNALKAKQQQNKYKTFLLLRSDTDTIVCKNYKIGYHTIEVDSPLFENVALNLEKAGFVAIDYDEQTANFIFQNAEDDTEILIGFFNDEE